MMEKSHRLNELKSADLEDGVCSWTSITDEVFTRYEYSVNIRAIVFITLGLLFFLLISAIIAGKFSSSDLLYIFGIDILFALLFVLFTNIRFHKESAKIVIFRMDNDKIDISGVPDNSYHYKTRNWSAISSCVRFKKVDSAELQPEHSRIILSQGTLKHVILIPEDDFGPISEFIIQRIDEAGRPG
jgi:hypothetical protein